MKEYKNTDPSDYKESMSLSYSYDALNIVVKSGNYYIMNLPVKYDLNYINLSERKFPLIFQTTEGTSHKVTIAMPAGFSVKGLPEAPKIKNKHFTYFSEYKIEENKIIFIDHFERTSIKVEKESDRAIT